MTLEPATLLVAGLLITVLHTVAPDHWLPYVVVGRARRWSLRRTLRLTFLSSMAHVGLTILLGLGLALVSLEVLEKTEGLQGILTAGILMVIGLALMTLTLRPHVHSHRPRAEDIATQASLFSLAALAPCYAILPIFLSVQTLGWGMTLGLAALFGAVTVAMMGALVTASSCGLVRASRAGAWARMERYEGVLLGGVLTALGFGSLWL